MAQNPNIRVGVDTDDAVKNLSDLEGAAVDAEKKVEALDGDTVKIDAKAAISSLDDVSKRLDEADDKARKAGSPGGGINTTTTAFKDLTEGIGGPGAGGTAVGALFGFGEAFEGLGDILEGFGGKLGLSETQINKLTTGLGNGLAALGALGAAITIASVAYEGFKSLTGGAAKEQEAFNEAVKQAQTDLKEVTELLAEGRKAEAYRKIVENLTDQFVLFEEAGVEVADVVRAIAENDRTLIQTLKETERELYDQGAALEYEAEAAFARNEISQEEYDARIAQVEALDRQATKVKEVTELLNLQITANENNGDIMAIVDEALGKLNTTTDRSIELERERRDAIRETIEAEIDAIDTRRDFERSLDDVQQALADYSQEILDAKGDTEKIEDATRDAADEVIELAKEYGGLEGAAVGTEEWSKRTTDALGYVAATLAPDSPLRAELLAYKTEIENIPEIKNTTFGANYSSTGEPQGVRQGQGGNINITVNGALDSNAVGRQIVNILKDYRRRYGNMDLGL